MALWKLLADPDEEQVRARDSAVRGPGYKHTHILIHIGVNKIYSTTYCTTIENKTPITSLICKCVNIKQ